MKLLIDLERCEGHGLCEEAAPNLLRLDEESQPYLISEDIDAHEAEARAAVRVCPVAALRLG
ncbi:MAG: ferredoxin [Microbacterium sp.]|uniref:ferredoxin n=1 Tax=Microbacterium sp. TaxID=51671 RepID=UPI00271DEF3D|nr:ferredoxin [Microbacterium sp.]MDO8383873.1 ferredoxin [Microbacterium sp.]